MATIHIQTEVGIRQLIRDIDGASDSSEDEKIDDTAGCGGHRCNNNNNKRMMGMVMIVHAY